MQATGYDLEQAVGLYFAQQADEGSAARSSTAATGPSQHNVAQARYICPPIPILSPMCCSIFSITFQRVVHQNPSTCHHCRQTTRYPASTGFSRPSLQQFRSCDLTVASHASTAALLSPEQFAGSEDSGMCTWYEYRDACLMIRFGRHAHDTAQRQTHS